MQIPFPQYPFQFLMCIDKLRTSGFVKTKQSRFTENNKNKPISSSFCSSSLFCMCLTELPQIAKHF